MRERKKDEREKPLLFNLVKVVRFLISPKKKKVKIEVNKIMNPAFYKVLFFLLLWALGFISPLRPIASVSHSIFTQLINPILCDRASLNEESQG